MQTTPFLMRLNLFKGIGVTLLCFLTFRVSAQTNLDSLKQRISDRSISDTIRLETIAYAIDMLYENKEVDYYVDLMGEIAKKNLAKKNLHPKSKRKFTLYLAAYYNNISIRLEDKQDPRSMDFLNRSLKLYQSVDAKDEVYTAIVSQGVLFARRKKYKEAIACYYKSLKYFELNEKENRDGISYVHSNLGVVYGEQGQWEMAIVHLKKAIRNIDLKTEQITVEDELQKFIMYYNIGSAYITLGKEQQAKENLEKALTYSRKYEQNSFTSYALGKLGLLDIKHARLEEAEQKLLEANKLAENDASKAFSAVYLGEVYLKKKNDAQAQVHLEKGLEIAQQINNLDLQEISTHFLYAVYKRQGSYQQALRMLEKYDQIKDSIDENENKNELLKQELKYNYEKQALKSKLINERKNTKKNNALVVLSLCLFLIIIVAYLIHRNSKQKLILNKYEKSELKQKLLVSQMNPHFIFNSLNAIQNSIFKQDGLTAGTYLVQFADLMRMILDFSRKDLISLESEINLLENYLKLQQFRFKNKFEYRLEVDPELKQHVVKIPPMLAQPFIENAIEHGIFHQEETGLIHISIFKKGANMRYEIQDNGIGLKKSQILKKKSPTHKSLATIITQERIDGIFLSKKASFQLQVIDLNDLDPDQTGVRVVFEIPLTYAP